MVTGVPRNKQDGLLRMGSYSESTSCSPAAWSHAQFRRPTVSGLRNAHSCRYLHIAHRTVWGNTNLREAVHCENVDMGRL